MKKRSGSLALKNKSGELTQQEKLELANKVYPALKNPKKHPIFRLLRFSASAVMLVLCSACATVDTPVQQTAAAPAGETQQQNLVSMSIRNGITKPDEPAAFELAMPESDIALASVYKYSKEPTVLTIAQDAVDFDYENGILVILKKDRLETNFAKCVQINFSGKFNSVQLSGELALLSGEKEAAIADIRQCGIVREFTGENKGYFLNQSGLLEFTPKHYIFSDRLQTKTYNEGDFVGTVIYGALGTTHMLFATDTGKLALMNMHDGRFNALSPGNYNIKDIKYVGNDIYIYTKENKLLMLQADLANGTIKQAGEAQGKDGCFFLKRSGKIYCDGYITDINTAEKAASSGDSGLYSEGMLFLKKEGVLSFVDSEKVYRQSVLIGSPAQNQVCVKDGRGYFLDLDLKIKYFTADGVESVPSANPESCDYVFTLKEGAVKAAGGKVIYEFAKPVNRSVKAVMLKRIIGQDIYYYFEKQ